MFKKFMLFNFYVKGNKIFRKENDDVTPKTFVNFKNSRCKLLVCKHLAFQLLSRDGLEGGNSAFSFAQNWWSRHPIKVESR